MWKVLFILTVLTVNCEPYSKKPKTTPGRNQRIIKVQGPPYFNHFYGHQKPLRKRPFGPHPGDEFIRPKYPPPIPPFFNGPSTNHIKHLPRPPPHVFHKSPSYGLGFPYKSITSYRPTISKDKFRIQSISPLPVKPAVTSSSSSASISSSTTYNSPIFTPSSSPSSSFISSPVSHIISSDDNNGPIREIPAPNLAPKPHESSFGTISVVSDTSGISGVNGIDGLEGVSGIGSISGFDDIEGVGGIDSVKIHGISDIGVLHAVRGNGVHGISEFSAGGGIHGVGATRNPGEIGDVAAVGGVTHLEPEALLHTVAKNPNGVNLDAIVKDQGLEINTYIKESGGDVAHGKEPTVEIANFDEGSSIDVTNLIKEAAGTSDHHSGYEVTEHHNNLPSNDQIIKGQDGTKLYYAPDPDPSLPVHKIPPTNDPHSTPSNGQNMNTIYIPQISHGFQYLQSGSVGAPLSSQELFHLMHGYPAVISQPVVAFVGQPQTPGVILSGTGHNYFQQNLGSYEGGRDHYSQNEEEGNDISQYLQQPEIHNLIHNSGDSNYEQGGSHSSVVSHSVYSPQNQYQGYSSSHYQSLVKNSNLNSETSNTGNMASTEISHNHQYEPEASESEHHSSLTVIKQTNEGNLNSEIVKELLLEETTANELSLRGKDEDIPTVLQLKNIPEVPFYASLPSKKAAEALAGLQAAGSIASNYMKNIKVLRGDQTPEKDQAEERGRRFETDGSSRNDRASKNQLLKNQRKKTVVDIQRSVPLYETSISSKNLVESDDEEEEVTETVTEFYTQNNEEQNEDEFKGLDFKEEGLNETFGKRIRPK